MAREFIITDPFSEVYRKPLAETVDRPHFDALKKSLYKVLETGLPVTWKNANFMLLTYVGFTAIPQVEITGDGEHKVARSPVLREDVLASYLAKATALIRDHLEGLPDSLLARAAHIYFCYEKRHQGSRLRDREIEIAHLLYCDPQTVRKFRRHEVVELVAWQIYSAEYGN